MFEKEAEEYAVLNARQYIHNEDIGFCTSEEEVRQAYQKGAESGYNKANEWHKSDIPTSQINKVVLGYIKDYNSKMFCLVKWNGEWWYDARTYNERVKLIAWREITLPKEIKENEQDAEATDFLLIRENDSEWREPTIEVEE